MLSVLAGWPLLIVGTTEIPTATLAATGDSIAFAFPEAEADILIAVEAASHLAASSTDSSLLGQYQDMLRVSPAMRARLLNNYDATHGRHLSIRNPYEVFRDNLARIDQICHDIGKTERCPFGKNEFSDMAHDDFVATHLGLEVPTAPSRAVAAKQGLWRLWQLWNKRSGTVDWRGKGVLTAVKNQYSCGSCWAFSAVEQIESDYAIASGHLLDLSPQQLLSTAYGWIGSPTHGWHAKHGCNGGWPPHAIVAAFAIGGVLNATALPYQMTATPSEQVLSKLGTVALALSPDTPTQFKGVKDVASGDTFADYKSAMIDMLHDGPLSAAMDASLLSEVKAGYTIETYGPLTRQECGNNRVNHAVQIVAYISPGDYFVIRNSWGSGWADGGYVAVKADACLIVSDKAWQTHMPEQSRRPPPSPPPLQTCDCSWTTTWACPGVGVPAGRWGYARDDGSTCFVECCPVASLRDLFSRMAADTKSFLPSPASCISKSCYQNTTDIIVDAFSQASNLGDIVSAFILFFSKINSKGFSSSGFSSAWMAEPSEQVAWLAKMKLIELKGKEEAVCMSDVIEGADEFATHGVQDDFFRDVMFRQQLVSQLKKMAEGARGCDRSKAFKCDCSWTSTWPCSTSSEGLLDVILGLSKVARDDGSQCFIYCCGVVERSIREAKAILGQRDSRALETRTAYYIGYTEFMLICLFVLWFWYGS